MANGTLTLNDLEEILKLVRKLNYIPPDRLFAPPRGQLDWGSILTTSTYPRFVNRTNMIVHNTSDKFIKLHENRIRGVLRANRNLKWVAIRLREPREKIGDIDFQMNVMSSTKIEYIVTLELVNSFDDKTGDIVLTPQSETDLETIEKWENQNEKFNLNDF